MQSGNMPSMFLFPGISPFWDYAPKGRRLVGIGFLPVLTAGLGTLILKGQRMAALLLAAIYAGVGVYHIAFLARVLMEANRVFSGRTGERVTVAIGFIALSIFFAGLNWLVFRKKP